MTPNSTNSHFTTSQKAKAWAVHFYTALGGVFGFIALIFASQNDFRGAFLMLMFSMLIDGTDGILARYTKVTEVLPNFDGAMLDNVIDMFTYAWVPIFIMFKLGNLPSPLFLLFPIFGSLYAYGQVNMKTPDDYFLGFPTYWSLVAMYIYILHMSGDISAWLLVVLGVLSFIPTRYLYPSKNPNKFIRGLFFSLGLPWVISVVLGVWDPQRYVVLSWLSLVYPVLYMGISLYEDFRLRGLLNH